MGEDLKQRQQHDDDEEDDQELFDSDSLLSNSDVDDRDHDGPLYELPTLVEQLPIKRGLSKYYQGKSQSYASLSVVRTLEDLPKKERPHKRKTMTKACGCRVMSRKAPSAASAAQEEEGGGGGKKPPPLHPLQKKYI